MNSHRATTKLLALASALGVVVGLSVSSGTAMASAAISATASDGGGARQQAIVSLAGSSAVTVPGLHVESLLSAVHVEIVDGTAGQLAVLRQQPGVLGVESNAKAHLEDSSWGLPNLGDLLGLLLGGNSSHGNPNPGNGNGNGNGNQPAPSPTPSPTPSASPTPTTNPSPTPSVSPSPSASTTPSPSTSPSASGSPDPSDSASPSPSPSPSDDGVIAPTTIGGTAGQPGAGKGATVALIDTGVTDTDALNRASGRLVDGVDTSGLNTDNGKIADRGTFTDGYGHGTFMASLIAGGKVAGSGDTALGVAPGATVDVVKVADDQGNTSLAAVLAGLDWVAAHSRSVDVANLSLSVDRPSNSYGIDPLNYAVSLTRDAGVTVVVAAGNTPGAVGDPGFAPDSLTVGAADTTAAKPAVASFSGYANVDGVAKPDVVATGVNVLGEMPANSLISQQYPDARQPSGLFRGSGTSQSTAVVSGLAALYIQTHRNASPLLVKSAIRNAATSIVSGPSDGQGLVGFPSSGNQRYNTGEDNLNIGQWFSTGSGWGAGSFDLGWLSSDWLSRSWLSRSWLSRSWMDGSWDSRSWLARTWLSRSWLSRSWVDGSWDSRSWMSRSWMSRSWMSRTWVSRTWTARSWMAATWGDGS